MKFVVKVDLVVDAVDGAQALNIAKAQLKAAGFIFAPDRDYQSLDAVEEGAFELMDVGPLK